MPAQPNVINNAPKVTGQDREADVAAMFNRIAATYDKLNDCISLGMHHQWKAAAIKQLNLTAGNHALDIATGTGDLAQKILPIVGSQGHITGVDISSDMLNVARQRMTEASNVSLDIGSAMALPYGDNQFDGTIISFGLRNVDDTQTVIREMARVTKPGSKVVSLDTAPDPWLPGFWWYFSMVMPTVGKWISGDDAAYHYLCESTRAFASPQTLAEQFKQAGLVNVNIKRLAFGSTAIISGTKAT